MFDRHPIVQRFHRLSPAQLLLLFYSLAIVISTILLSFPFVYQQGVYVPFIDRLFVAVSALSVTGLTPIDIGESLSVSGTIVLALILQLGAVGVMVISTFIWLLIGKKIGLSERRLIKQDLNQTSFGGMVQLIKQILLVILLIEGISFLLLGTYFLRYFPNPLDAYYHGFFSTISAISNGGFSLFSNSLEPYKHDYFVQSIVMLLIIFGAIGFPVLIEVKQFLFRRRTKKQTYRFSLFTKVTTVTFFSLIIIGTLCIYLFDVVHFFKGKAWHESLFYALFQSVTTRSAGLSTLDVSQLTDANHLFMALLMFIGASPSSAGGGIRTTTFALVIIFLITYARGGRKVRIFKREVYDEDLTKAVMITIFAVFLVFFSLLFMTVIESFSLKELLFEVTSAFGTVGLSLGITSELTTFSKIVLMVLMFIGRIGLVTFLYSFRDYATASSIAYPKERIIIG